MKVGDVVLVDEITAREIANLFGVSVTTVYSWEYKGYIKPARVSPSGRKYYSRQEVNKLYQDGQKVAQAVTNI